MPGTARQLGVDASNPSANLEGGARYLRMQLDAFGGDVEKALAAYNAGPGRVERARGVPNIPETQAYVAAVMARLAERIRR
jgi:soluble lytic murein transglycosylase-like protein